MGHGNERAYALSQSIPLPGPLFEDIRLSSLETTGDAAEECPRTPDRQGIPPTLHPPPVIKQPRIHMPFKCGAGRRLDFGRPEEDQPPTSGSEPSFTHHGENARKRARSVEVTHILRIRLEILHVGVA